MGTTGGEGIGDVLAGLVLPHVMPLRAGTTGGEGDW